MEQMMDGRLIGIETMMNECLYKINKLANQINKLSEELASISETTVVSYDEDTTTSTSSYDHKEEDTDRMDVVGQNDYIMKRWIWRVQKIKEQEE